MNIELQVLGSSLRSVAEEMGAVLIRSAFSANIKERRDCSAALFDEQGRMIAQAEHIPVHLGAMQPGSMPAGSRTLADEGLVIPPTRLDDDVLAALVAQMRNPEERRGDF